MTLDAALAGAEPSLIKLHLEGGELDAVEGAAETIRRCAPRLAVCLHRDEDALRIPGAAAGAPAGLPLLAAALLEQRDGDGALRRRRGIKKTTPGGVVCRRIRFTRGLRA